MSHKRVFQAITTRYLPFTNTRPARIKATAAAGSITVSMSKINGDNGEPGIEGDDNRHRAVAKMLQAKYGWTNPLRTGCLPNGDYVHIQVDQQLPIHQLDRDGRLILVDGVPALHIERWQSKNRFSLAPWQVDDIAKQVYNAMAAGAIRIPLYLDEVQS